MEPDNFHFGGGVADTRLLPLVAVLMLLTIGLILGLRRKYMIIPFLLCAFLIPMQETVVLGGVHFFVLRIVLLFAWLRLLATRLSSSKSLFSGRLGKFDAIFTFWALYHVFATFIIFKFQSGAMVNQFGFLLDAFGSYFLLRYLIRDAEDIVRVVKVLVVVAAMAGLSMVTEKVHNLNLFGCVGANFVPQVRDGAIRAQGPFAHPILAGAFGATLLPLFFVLYRVWKQKALALVGFVASSAMTITAASSTPLTSYVAGVVTLCMFPMRNHMRKLRWAIVILLVSLHLAMKAPVWFLIARVDLTGASSGYHRAMLVDTCIRHFSEWWLVGTDTNGTWGNDMYDLSNQFVAEAVSGGLATFVAFVAMVSICFSKLGIARKRSGANRNREWLLWALGATMMANVVAFWGISYFDHVQVEWFALLAMILAATSVIPALTEKQVITASVDQTALGAEDAPDLAWVVNRELEHSGRIELQNRN